MPQTECTPVRFFRLFLILLGGCFCVLSPDSLALDTTIQIQYQACLTECGESAKTEIDQDADGLTQCVENCMGLDDTEPDRDRDGMPDGWEVLNGLDPFLNDAGNDPDEDALSNIEEFRLERNPTIPETDGFYYIAPTGAETNDGMRPDTPWPSITFAIDELSTLKISHATLVLAPGDYHETLVDMPANFALLGSLNGVSTIYGIVSGNSGCALKNVALKLELAVSFLLILEQDNMLIEKVVFEGDSTTVGIMQTSPSAANIHIRQCAFNNLSTAIMVAGGIPTVFRCVFETLTSAAIFIVPLPEAKGLNGKSIGDTDDPNSGFNHFSAGSLAIVNMRPDTTVLAEHNDWDTDNPAAIQSRVFGNVSTASPLKAGSALFPSSIFCTLWDGNQDKYIGSDAFVRLSDTSYGDISNNDDGVYVFPVLAAGNYTLIATATGFETITRIVSVEAGEPANVFIDMAHTPSDPVPPTGCQMGSKTFTTPNPADVFLAALSFGVLLTLSNGRYRLHR